MASNPLEALAGSPAADITSQPPTGSPSSSVGSPATPLTQPDSSPGAAVSPPASSPSDNSTNLGDTSSSSTSSSNNSTSLGDTSSNNTSSTVQVEPPPVTSSPVETVGATPPSGTTNSLPLPAATSGTSSNPGSSRDLKPQDLFDEKYYLAQYPEVKTAVSSGAVPTAYQHFIKYGQFENRSPCAQFNPKVYLSLNLDIKASLQTGAVGSAFEHFYKFGAKEQRPIALTQGSHPYKLTLSLSAVLGSVGSAILGGTIAPRAKVDPLTGSPTLNGAIIDKPAFTPDPTAKYHQFSVNTQPSRLTLQLGGEILSTVDSLLRLAPSSFPGGVFGNSFGYSGVASSDRSRWAAPWGNGVDLALPSGLPWGLASGGISAKPTQLRGFDAEPC